MGFSMRIGTLAYDTPTGLGYQVKSYIKHLPINKIMVSDLTIYNGMQKMGWYDNAFHVHGYPTDEQIDEFLNDVDVMLFAETPLNYNFYKIARIKGVKTAVVINWEFFDHIVKPELPLPDLIIMPSVWHYKDAQEYCYEKGVKLTQIHHPVDLDEIIYRKRTTNSVMHIAGKPATHDRNGTLDFLNAMPDGTVITQSEDFAKNLRRQFRYSSIYTGINNQAEIYSYGDIMVLPRKYGGNCLPLNEALASGMPVIMPDIEPNNNLLPKEWLVPAVKVDSFTPRTQIDIYNVDTSDLRNKIHELQSMNIAELSEKAYSIANSISWATLKDKYIAELKDLL